jgi:hypothetical protein
MVELDLLNHASDLCMALIKGTSDAAKEAATDCAAHTKA